MYTDDVATKTYLCNLWDFFLYRRVGAQSKHKPDRDRVVYKSGMKYKWVNNNLSLKEQIKI